MKVPGYNYEFMVTAPYDLPQGQPRHYHVDLIRLAADGQAVPPYLWSSLPLDVAELPAALRAIADRVDSILKENPHA